MSDYGLVLSVFADPKGSALSTAASVSDTVLYVDDAQDFNDEGGILDLNGARLQYTSLVEGENPGDPDEINLADPLAVAADEDDSVCPVAGNLIPEDWYAVVTMGDDGDVAHVPIDVDQRNQWPIGEYPDPVPVIVSDDLQHILDAPGRTVASRNSFCNTDTYVYDGIATDIRLPLTKIPISGSEQPFWKADAEPVGGQGLPPGTWRIEGSELIVDDAGLMAEFGADDLFWVDYTWDEAAADISRPPESPPPTYVDEVLADNPILYWRFGESSGTVANDASGNGRNGTYTNGPTLGSPSLLASDSSNTAVTFDGVDDYVAYSDTTDLSDFSVECWFQTTSDGYLIQRWPTTSSQRIFILVFNGGVPYFEVVNNAGVGSFCQPVSGNYGDNQPHHVVATYAAGVLKIYVDGAQVATASMSGTLRTFDAPFEVGGRSASTFPFPGVIDEVAYYGTALSAARVLAHYNAGI